MRLPAGLLVLGALLAARPVHARTLAGDQPRLEQLCEEPARPETAPPLDEVRRKAASDLTRHAAAAYAADRYIEALDGLRAAYVLTPVADILFNMAQACRAAGLDEAALRLYLRTLDEHPDDELRKIAEQRAAVLGRQVAATRAHQLSAEREAAARAVEAERRAAALRESNRYYRRWWFWTAIGGVVVVGVTAAVLGTQLHTTPSYDDPRDIRFP